MFEAMKSLAVALISILCLGAPVRADAAELHDQAARGDVQAMQGALASGANIDERDSKGLTPLMRAAGAGKLDAVRLLIERGAKVNSAEPRFSYTALHFAATLGRAEGVAELAKAGANIEARASVGVTPLQLACAKGHLEAASVLLDRGAQIEAVDDAGWTPLHWAAREGQTELVRLLLQRKASVNASAGDGFTPLHMAASKGHVEAVKLLLSGGAKAELKTRQGWTARQVAEAVNQRAIVEALDAHAR